jgi:hypothetical protein
LQACPVSFQFRLILTADLEGTDVTRESWLGSNANNGVLVEQYVDPFNPGHSSKVVEAFVRIGDESVNIFFLVDEAVVSAKADVRRLRAWLETSLILSLS